MTPAPEYTLRLITASREGLELKVRAVPGKQRDRLLGVHGDALRVAVRAPPERGKANAALVDVLSSELQIPRSAVTLLRGEASRDKVLRIGGLSHEELARRLGQALSPPLGKRRAEQSGNTKGAGSP